MSTLERKTERAEGHCVLNVCVLCAVFFATVNDPQIAILCKAREQVDAYLLASVLKHQFPRLFTRIDRYENIGRGSALKWTWPFNL